MSYAEVLDVIARLHVDRDLRRAFLADPAAALASADLTEGERGALVRLDPRMVAIIGRIADAHRWTRIQEHLPWVDDALRPDLAAIVERYLTITPPPLLNRDEALAFCRYLERDPGGSPPYLGEIARHERLRISVAWGLDAGGIDPRDASFDFPIPRILAALGDPGWPSVERSPTRLSFRKVPGIPAVLVRG